MKKILITGISGFAGSFLAEYLASQRNIEIYGTYLADASLEYLKNIRSKIFVGKVDLIQKNRVADFIRKVKPDFIYHLAALSSPADSFKNPEETIVNNIVAQLNLFEAVRDIGLIHARILVISSGDSYGIVNIDDLPIDENTPFMPVSPYAVSKITQDYLALQYHLSYRLQVIRARPFNHIGPRQSPNFVVASFAKRIAEIERGIIKPVLRVGNLETKRDFTDVRDMVRAYVLILEKGKIGDVYNIGSGKAYEISQIVDKLLSFAKKKIEIKVDKSLLRPNDTPVLLCDNRKFKKVTNWEPQMPLDITLQDTLDYWRNLV